MQDVGQRQSRFVTALFLIVFVAALLVMLRLVVVYLSAIVLALVLASLFWGVFERLTPRVGGRKNVASGLTTTLVVIVVIVPLAFILTSLSAQAYSLYERASSDEGLLREVRGFLSGESALAQQARELGARAGLDLSPERITDYAQEVGKSAGLFLYEQIGGFASNAIAVLVHFSMMLIFLFAFFAEGTRLKAYILDLSPLPDDEEEMIAERFSSIARAVFLGNGLGSAAQGLMGGISFYLFGIGSGILWGTAIAFFAFLPIVGGSVVILPAAVWLLLQGQWGMAIGFLAFNAVQIGLLEYGLKTKLIGGQSQMNGVLVFFGIVAGLSLFGILGLFYGPLIITMFLTLAEIYKEHYRDNLMQVVAMDIEVGVAPEDRDPEPEPGAPDDPGPAPAGSEQPE
jgi:predicted PurR-regulated permease PerM